MWRLVRQTRHYSLFWIVVNWQILKNVISWQLVWKNATYKDSLRFMPLFSCKFDRIASSFFTNEKDKRGKLGQHSNLLMKKVAWHAIMTYVVNLNIKCGMRSNFLQLAKTLFKLIIFGCNFVWENHSKHSILFQNEMVWLYEFRDDINGWDLRILYWD